MPQTMIEMSRILNSGLILIKYSLDIHHCDQNISTRKLRKCREKNPIWRPALHRLARKSAYRFFLLFHSCRHLRYRSVDGCKIRKIWYVFCFENWHWAGGVQRPSPESYFAHLEMTRFYANATVTLQDFRKNTSVSRFK